MPSAPPVLDTQHTPSHKLNAVRDALQELSEDPLQDWVAVALWGDSGDAVSVVGEGTVLQMKGHLHSGIWTLASSPAEPPSAPERVNVRSAEDVREFPGGHMSVVRVGGAPIGRGIFEPGWRWSESIAPIIGEKSCPLQHVAFVLKGGMHFVMDTGEEFDARAGDVIHLAPGHDAWVVGEEPCEMLEVLSAGEYGKKL